ncbi:transposase [Bacteroides acidifaciens]|uniref:transposase n=1 Tax=Bacteroides acidifaciens TaxID=85831 RepID=UPI00214A0CFC|nr:transposase [Bacteroides acidifaciens]MCR2007175.1 transposase [Bacteroides acidifaciens]
MGYHLCIDETALSKGDLYTILINRDKRGRKGSIIAAIQGTKTDDIIAVLTKMPQELRNQVKEITLDMAGSMQKIAKTCFPRAMQVILIGFMYKNLYMKLYKSCALHIDGK